MAEIKATTFEQEATRREFGDQHVSGSRCAHRVWLAGHPPADRPPHPPISSWSPPARRWSLARSSANFVPDVLRWFSAAPALPSRLHFESIYQRALARSP